MTAPGAPPTRARRWFRRAILALLVILVGSALALRSRLEPWVRAELAQRLQADFGAELKLGDLRVGLLPLSAEFSELDLLLPPERGGELRVAVKHGKVRLAWRDLIGRDPNRLRIRELTLVEPDVRTDESFLNREGDRRVGEPLPFDLRIDRLEVRNGRWRHVDTELPLDFTLDGVELDATWSPDRRAMLGRVEASVSVLSDPLEAPLELALQSSFVWRPSGIEFHRLEGRGEALELEMDGTLNWSDRFLASGGGTVRSRLGRLSDLFESSVPEMSGEAWGAFEIRAGRGDLRVEGDFQARRASFLDIEADAVAAHAVYTPGTLSLTELDAATFGGAATGTVLVELSPSTTFRVEVEGRRLASPSLLSWIDLPLPLASRIDCEVELEGRAESVASWTGRGEFRASADAALVGVPTSGEGSFELSRGRMRLRADKVRARSARLEVGMDLDVSDASREGYLLLEGTTSDAGDTQAGTLGILEALEIDSPPLATRPLRGAGPVRARVDFAPAETIELRLALDSGAWGGEEFDHAALDLQGSADRTVLRNLELTRGAERLAGSAVWVGDDPVPIELQLEAREVDVGKRAPVFFPDLEVGGRISGTLGMSSGEEGRIGSGEVTWVDGSIFGEAIDEVEATVAIEGGVVRLDPVTVRAPAGRASGRMQWDLERSGGILELDQGEIDPGSLELLRAADLALEGSLLLAGRFELHPGGFEGTATVEGQDWALRGLRLGSFGGDVKLSPDRVEAKLIGSGESGWMLEGAIGLLAELPVQATLRLDRSVLEPTASEGSSVWARASGELSVRGPLSDPDAIRLDGTLTEGEIFVGPHRLELADPLPVRVESGLLRLESIHLAGQDTDLRARIVVDPDRPELDVTGAGTVDLALISAVAPEVRASGGADVEFTLGGTIEQPRLAGSLEIAGGRLRWLGFPQTLDQLDARLSLEGSEVKLERVRGLLGGGEVTGRGRVALSGSGIETYRVDLEGHNVRIGWPEGFEGIYEARLSLGGDLERSRLSGRVEVLRGLYSEQADLGRMLGFGTREYSSGAPDSLPANLTLDVDLVADDNVWVRNDLARFESRFDFHLGGTLQRPELTGRLDVQEGGTIAFRDVTYRIVTCSLDFVELDRLDPYLFLRAETNVAGYEIELRVEGKLDRFEYELTSNPSLSPQDIIAVLTTGSTLQELTAGGGGNESVTGDLAANYFAGALTAPFERQIERLLKLERVQINPLLVEGSADPTTRVTVGKRVAEDLFVVVSSNVGTNERNLYQVEWRATPKHLITVQQDSEAGIGGDIRYTNRYWWKRRPGKSEEAVPVGNSVPSETPSEATVGVVKILGAPPDQVEALLKRVPLKPGDPFKRSEMFAGVEAIRRQFIKMGKIEADVTVSAAPSASGPGITDLEYNVRPGPPVHVGLDGASGKDERRLRGLLQELWTRSLFLEDIYTDSAERILRYYREKGYYAADVHHTVEDGAEGREVLFRIDRGEPVRVKRIVIQGAEQLSEEQIRRQMLTRRSSLFSRGRLDPSVLDEDLAAIRNLYRDHGFLAVVLQPPRIRLSATADSAEITLEIEEGPRFTIADIEMPSGLPIEVGTLLSWSGLSVGEQYSPAKLLRAESRLRAELDRQGYPDSRVRGLVEIGERDVRVHFEVEPGEIKRVGTIAVRGNRLTREKVIRRELKLATGDLISREGLLRIQHRLYRLGVFRNVRVSYEPMPGGDPSLQRVLVDVDEAPPLGLRVGIGYDSEAGVETGVSTTHDNLGGRVRTVGIQAFASRILRRAQIVGKEPRLFGRTLPALFDYSVEHREEVGFTVDRRSTAIRVDHRINPKWSGYLRYNWQWQDLSDITDTVALREEKLENLKLGDLGISLIRDGRDDPLRYTDGTYFAGGVRLFDEFLLSDFSFLKASFSGSSVRTYRNGTTLAVFARVALADSYGSTDTIPISERFFAGGASTLRGFGRDEVGPREECTPEEIDECPLGKSPPIGGEAMFLLNQEFRFPIRGRLRGLIFYDAGNVYERLRDFDPLDLRHVIGAGLRIVTPFGPLRAEYGWKLDRQPGESGGQFHLAIGEQF